MTNVVAVDVDGRYNLANPGVGLLTAKDGTRQRVKTVHLSDEDSARIVDGHSVSAPDVLILALQLQALVHAIAGNPTTAVQERAYKLAQLAGHLDYFAASDHRDAVQAGVCADVARSALRKLVSGGAR